jgi:hypothetical protein
MPVLVNQYRENFSRRWMMSWCHTYGECKSSVAAGQEGSSATQALSRRPLQRLG